MQDPTFISESLCRDLYVSAGVPAPTADFVTVLINSRDLGLYVMLEGYGKDFLRKHFSNVKGNLYDGGFCQDVNAPLAVNSGEHPEDRSDLDRLVAAANQSDITRRWKEMSEVLDVDRFITLLAIEVLTCNWDGYSLNRNNYRVFHDLERDKMVFMPHGLDQMFGWPPERFRTDSSIYPYNMRGIIARAIIGTPEGSRMYLRKLHDLRDKLFQADSMLERVDKIDQRIRPTLAAYDPNAVQWHDAAVKALCTRIVQRLEFVSEEMARPKATPDFDSTGVTQIGNWPQTANSQGSALKLERISEDGRQYLHFSAAGRSGGTGSFRTRVQLEPGKYRFEGKARVNEQAFGGRVLVRVSGGRSSPSVVTDTNWIALSSTFTVESFLSEVVLVCEFSSPRGDAWFDRDSLKLVRIDQP